MERKATLPTVEHEVHHLVPGMETARDICSEDGRMLVTKGTIISRETINTLKNWSIQKVPVLAQATMTPITDPKLQQFVNQYNNSVSAVQNTFEAMRTNQEVPIEHIKATTEELVDTVHEAGNVIDRLYNLPHCDDYTFHHCVNVSVISALIGLWLKFPTDVINAISLAALLHDIGKSQLPPNLLNQSCRLNAKDYEQYKLHVAFGEELARKVPDLAESIIAGIVQHHERADGSGYPHGLTREDIHPYAQIVAVADLYDEQLTIDRQNDKEISPYTSLELLWDNVYKLDAEACLIFTDRMSDYISGNIVALNDGRQGRVVFVNKRYPSRCMVQLGNGEVLDLAANPKVCIHHLVR